MLFVDSFRSGISRTNGSFHRTRCSFGSDPAGERHAAPPQDPWAILADSRDRCKDFPMASKVGQQGSGGLDGPSTTGLIGDSFDDFSAAVCV